MRPKRLKNNIIKFVSLIIHAVEADDTIDITRVWFNYKLKKLLFTFVGISVFMVRVMIQNCILFYNCTVTHQHQMMSTWTWTQRVTQLGYQFNSLEQTLIVTSIDNCLWSKSSTFNGLHDTTCDKTIESGKFRVAVSTLATSLCCLLSLIHLCLCLLISYTEFLAHINKFHWRRRKIFLFSTFSLLIIISKKKMLTISRAPTQPKEKISQRFIHESW